jgi:CRISPR/Cas system-associated endonuclease/helicase Cas3
MPKNCIVNSECSRKTIISKEHLDQNKTDFKDTPMSYLVPLISVLTDGLESAQNRELKATNGPLLIVVCSSKDKAQRIHKLVEEMIEISNRDREYDSGIKLKKLKTILLPDNSYCYEGNIVLLQKDFFTLFSYIYLF